jgi:exonuclease SbcD
MTRLLHTGDWHLGRYLHGVSLLEDQAHVLDQFVALASTEKVDAVVIAGDVYDRSVPPADAVALLGDVLARLVVDCGIPVVVVAGNHDSADRIGFGGRIFGKQGLHLRGTLDDLSPVLFHDAHGTVALHPLPYVEPVFARALPGGEDVCDHQSAMSHVVSMLRAQRVPGHRNVLVGHAFVAGGSESDSERPLSVGGSGMVAADTFAGFDFVALGHLHRPQTVASDRIHYAGSLLMYSFDEVDHAKSVSLVDIGADGVPSIRRVCLAQRRDVRIVTGTSLARRSTSASRMR